MIPSDNEIKKDMIHSIYRETSIIRYLNKCLICKMNRADLKHDRLIWDSNYIINYGDRCQIFTICPNCRDKTTINQIFTKLMLRVKL
jgi:hypothetical protein